MNVYELQDIGEEYSSKRRLVDNMREKLTRAKRIAPIEQQELYVRLLRDCQTMETFYTQMAEVSNTLSSESETLIIRLRNQLEENVEENRRRFG